MTAMTDDTAKPDPSGTPEPAADATAGKGPQQKPGEIGGPKGPEPTRYGDWEFRGRCSDF
nr:succinate dehydrogenase assembly factor 4 [Azospirillum halopraeferens]